MRIAFDDVGLEFEFEFLFWIWNWVGEVVGGDCGCGGCGARADECEGDRGG